MVRRSFKQTNASRVGHYAERACIDEVTSSNCRKRPATALSSATSARLGVKQELPSNQYARVARMVLSYLAYQANFRLGKPRGIACSVSMMLIRRAKPPCDFADQASQNRLPKPSLRAVSTGERVRIRPFFVASFPAATICFGAIRVPPPATI